MFICIIWSLPESDLKTCNNYNLLMPQTKSKTPSQQQQEVTPPVPVPVPVPVESAVADQNVEVVTLDSHFSKAFEMMAVLSLTVKDLQAKLKVMQRESSKAMKSYNKKVSKKNGVKRAPSGFAKPCQLSDDLCKFLGLSEKCQMARNEATKLIHEYIKTNNLQDPSDKRTILVDDKMKTIINTPSDVKLTYFNLQTYIKQHFTAV